MFWISTRLLWGYKESNQQELSLGDFKQLIVETWQLVGCSKDTSRKSKGEEIVIENLLNI